MEGDLFLGEVQGKQSIMCKCKCWETGKGITVFVLCMTIWTFICNILAVEPDAPWYTRIRKDDDSVRLTDEDDTYYGKFSAYSVIGQSLWTYVSRTI